MQNSGLTSQPFTVVADFELALINNPLTTELYFLEVLFRLVAPVFLFLLQVSPGNLNHSFFHMSFTSS